MIIYSVSLSNKIISLENDKTITIDKGESVKKVLSSNFKKTKNYDLFLLYYIYKINSYIKKSFMHYGEFYIDKNITYINFINVISKPSNVLNKITIVEGWSKKELNFELSKYFDDFYTIDYNLILADTYYFKKQDKFKDFVNKLKTFKNNYFKKIENNFFFKNYNQNDLMIIGSLLEKEGLDYEDKKKISSVIRNRLNKNMRLQIDATVIYALTNGKYDLNRKLTINDLKFDHPFNTYIINGLPPSSISYVGTKTIDIILENYTSDNMFYFYNSIIKKHDFSRTFEEHKKKLNEYRNKK